MNTRRTSRSARLAFVGLGLLALLAALLVLRASGMQSLQPDAEPVPVLSVDISAAAERLAGAVRLRTVSYETAQQTDAQALLELHRYLEQQFPEVHRHLNRETINELSLIYTWTGSDPGLAPILLSGHLDVVPASEDAWEHPPFAGHVDDSFVWGRGTMDDKVGVLGLLEATEFLLGNGFVPRRTVTFAFGHDEELDGLDGAAAIAEHFQAQGLRFDFVLDEGMMVVEGIVPGLAAPAALIGTAEKGFANVELVARTAGGHSSVPPDETAVGILAAAVARLEAEPMPARLEGPVREMLRHVAPEVALPWRLVLGNLWLSGPLVARQFAASPATNAAIRTTAAPTMLQASDKANVLASRASAVVNYRILPGDSIEEVLKHVRAVVDDPRVEIGLGPGESHNPTPVSRIDVDGFRHIATSVRAVFPDAVAAPSLVIPATDARHYQGVSDQVYRFLPIPVTAEDLDRFHGVNERVSLEAYAQVVTFYADLMRRAAG